MCQEMIKIGFMTYDMIRTSELLHVIYVDDFQEEPVPWHKHQDHKRLTQNGDWETVLKKTIFKNHLQSTANMVHGSKFCRYWHPWIVFEYCVYLPASLLHPLEGKSFRWLKCIYSLMSKAYEGSTHFIHQRSCSLIQV